MGKLVKGKKPGPRGSVSNIKILDPACGSGSFLLGAYQYLLDWHRDEYIKDGTEKWARGRTPRLYQISKGEWKLTIEERQRILLNNIYGVDIDPQAVEVTKLSLLLKVLEGEDEQTIGRQLSLFQKRVLPDLANNIKCGNSLIGPDFYDGTQMSFFDEDETYRINVFDWKSEFSEIMKKGGFDAVIGNPPYIRIQAMKEWAPIEVEFYKKHYASASKGNYDIYVVFVENGLNLLNKQGLLGFILPNKFLATDYGQELRKLISDKESLACLIDFEYEQVFEDSTTYTCLLFLTGYKSKLFNYVRIEKPLKISTNNLEFVTCPSDSLSEETWLLLSALEMKIVAKLKKHTVPLLELPTMISRGSSSGDDNIFILRRTEGKNQYITNDGERVIIEKPILRIPLFATDFTHYEFAPKSGKVIIFPYVKHEGGFRLLSESEIRTNIPKAFQYLHSRRKKLEQRKQYKKWYAFSAPRNLAVHDTAQMLIPLLADKGLLAELPENQKDYCLMASGGWITCTKQYVGQMPIPAINFNDPSDKARHDKIVKLVKRMLDLNEQLAKAKTPQTRTVLQRQIETTDRQIDELVYELYDLTKEEIKIVEPHTF